jgi:hypothetical protein
MIKVDEATLNRLLSDDLMYIHSTALLQSKKEFVDTLKAGTVKYISLVPSDADVKVRIIGNVAVVNGLAANVDTLGRPLCPCNFYPDPHEEAKQRRWICACDEMQKWKYCHCLLFVTPEETKS